MSKPADQKSKFWLDQVSRQIKTKFPHGEIVVSSGISPSAHYHIGHFREILTAEAIAWSLRRAGRAATHIHVIDDFDPLRQRYDFLPVEFERFVGWPLYKVPDPFGDCHPSYAEHFYTEFETYARKMGVIPTRTVRNSELYLSGKMSPAIEDVLKNAAIVRDIFAASANRKLGADWTPLQVVTKSGEYEQGKLSTWDKSAHSINGTSYRDGQVKMNWRLEWPARWRVLGVMVEPFSHQEHGAAGGSFDTGVQFAKKVFGFEPPLAGARYGNIHIKGDSKKMSSSKGNLYTPAQVLEVMPPEVLRYFVIKSRPEKQLDFDLQAGLYNLLEEFSRVEAALQNGQPNEFSEAMAFAKDLRGRSAVRTISSVPFNHLVFAFQTARGDQTRTLEILRRTGYDEPVSKETDVINRELGFVSRWLDKYAPEHIKFALQEKLPMLKLDEAQRHYLDRLADRLKNNPHEAQAIHTAVYECSTECGIKPAAAFELLYRLFLNKSAGPKIGFFLSSLEPDFVISRIARQG